MLNYVTIFFATKNKNNEILYFLKFTTFRILDRSPFYIVKVSSFIVVTVHTVITNQSFVTSIENTSKLFCCAFVCQHSSRNIDTLCNIRHSLENSFSMDFAILFATKWLQFLIDYTISMTVCNQVLLFLICKKFLVATYSFLGVNELLVGWHV